MSDPNSIVWVACVILLLILIAFYFIPTMIAFASGHPQRWWILLFNLALGGTGLGWFAALIWSFRKL